MRLRQAWDAALYGPSGFYRRERPAAHFRTSVHASPLFATAVARLAQALGETEIAGVHTNVRFLRRVAASPAFSRAQLDTGLIGRNPELLAPQGPASPLILAAAAYAELAEEERGARQRASTSLHIFLLKVRKRAGNRKPSVFLWLLGEGCHVLWKTDMIFRFQELRVDNFRVQSIVKNQSTGF